MIININSQSLYFSSPIELNKWKAPSIEGIYLILVKSNESSSFICLYIGQSEDLSLRGFPDNHHRYNCWVYNSNKKDIYVAFSEINGKERRLKIETELIEFYNPVCNKK